MKTFHSVFLGFLLLISCRSEAEQKSPSADKAILSQVLKQVFEKNELMGASVMLIADGNIAYQKYFGLADSARQIAIAENTVYRVASISKTIAATALMQLWQQGKVDLDANVDRYLGWPLQHPKFPDAPITLRLLMNHRSGIRDGKGYGVFSKDMIGKKLHLKDLFTPEGAYYTEDLFSERPPGDYFSYANCSWGLVASVIEKVSGLRFDEYCKKNIFEPLGMRASFNVLDLPDLDQLAVLYRYRDGSWVPQADHYQGQKPTPRFFEGYELGQNGLIFGPQGSLRSSAKDLATFALMLMNDGTWQRKSILKKESVDLMTANHWTFENGNGDTTGKINSFHNDIQTYFI